MITIIFAFIHEIIYFKINNYNLFNNYNLVSVDEQIHNIYAKVRVEEEEKEEGANLLLNLI